MAITFAVGESPENVHDEEALVFEPELRNYFRRLSIQIGIAPPDLTNLDPYGDTRFEGAGLFRLEREVDDLRSILEALYRKGGLAPSLEPPEMIGLETEPEGKPCGRNGVLQFLKALKTLSQKARKEGRPLLAIGD
ncbi:hypothetical protein [Candidatus Manganitrophus noduliformans]|uniref:Uncharacterized protein n=1 Tax=Candidatus Manganitrophus noduliformans TaxID=2606439 RepID=A0A7X6DRE7_9BACT|nr:hypothetical protein [Candidatus Manganitrophus noduliformans]NKE71970.1 hypothetical protein [Candidatus Manganitrophus noduliformans]